MTRDGDRIGGRYLVGRQDRALGELRRCAGTDEDLDRPVLLWISDGDGGADAEALLLATAQDAGRWSAGAFLRVLDVAHDHDRVAVVLERAGTPLGGGLVPVDPRSAGDALDAIDEAVATAHLARVSRQDLFVVDGEVLIDPIAIALPPAPGERAPSAALLRERAAALLIEHAEDAQGLARALSSEDATRSRAAQRAAVQAVAVGGGPYIDDAPTAPFAPAAAPAARAAAASPGPGEATPAADRVEVPREPFDIVAPAEPPTRRRGALPWRVFIPLYVTLAAVVVGAFIFALRGPSSGAGDAPPAAAGQTSGSGAPAVAPAAGHVTVGLVAREESGVRVTVDGIVQFDGTLAAGQRQAWDGKQRIDVWTDKGKTVEIAVNGKDLGPYSPAMGHPDWNRIDFSFWAGFGQ